GVANYDDYVGGIAGYIYGYQSVVSNCTNIGDIIGDDEVGGIVGYTNTNGTAFENYPNIYVFVTDCQNRGVVTGIGEDIGGIVGMASSSSAWIDRCSNSGNITGYEYVGGISGYRGSVSNCYNTGDIMADDYYAGGIIGYMYGNSPDYALLANCYNRGNVSANDYDAGGLVGYASDYSYITNCYTTGEVTAYSDFGAVIGNKYDSDVIMNALFYNDNLDNDNGFGTAMSAADMKSAVLLDTLNGYVNTWNPDNINFIQLEAWEFRNGLNDGYPVFGFSNVSVNEVAENGSFRVYPNPATDYVMIENENGEKAEIAMFDMFGKLVKSFGTTTDNLIRIDVSSLTNGVYVLRMGNHTAKIVKH
ncbi:MAG: T9SS type A sorting domain-containing protein, partial [Bacteroidales bacterium]|nr:T9SS type A sorting domain-containing protein [Bacteroidales bacterium]